MILSPFVMFGLLNPGICKGFHNLFGSEQIHQQYRKNEYGISCHDNLPVSHPLHLLQLCDGNRSVRNLSALVMTSGQKYSFH